MNKYSEVARFSFVRQRDGKQAALAFAKRNVRIYLAAIKDARKKQKTKRPALRKEMLQAAYSFRHIVRTLTSGH